MKKARKSKHKSGKTFWINLILSSLTPREHAAICLASENLVPGVNECRVEILYPFVALGIFIYLTNFAYSRKELIMPRMSKRNKREWELFINPKTGRKNYNDLCRKCLRQCKQSYRVIVVSCRRFAPNWGRKNAPDLSKNMESKNPM